MKIKKILLIIAVIIILALLAEFLYSYSYNNSIGNHIFSTAYQSSLQKPIIEFNINTTKLPGNNSRIIYPIVYPFYYFKGNITNLPAIEYMNGTILSCIMPGQTPSTCKPYYGIGDKNTTLKIHPNNTVIDNGSEYVVSTYLNNALFVRCSAMRYQNKIFVYFQLRMKNTTLNYTGTSPNNSNADICTYTVDFETDSINGWGISISN